MLGCSRWNVASMRRCGRAGLKYGTFCGNLVPKGYLVTKEVPVLIPLHIVLEGLTSLEVVTIKTDS